ncbi:MAG: SRPBCC domain-containing protein [Chloroflexota bacterium]
MNNSDSREFNVEITARAHKVWQAITDPVLTRQYYYGTDMLSDWKAGSRWTSESDGAVMLEGEILEIDPPRRLVQTFHVVHEEPAQSDPPSKVTWELTPITDGTRLGVFHEDQGQATLDYTEGGWEHILDGLKALVEAG